MNEIAMRYSRNSRRYVSRNVHEGAPRIRVSSSSRFRGSSGIRARSEQLRGDRRRRIKRKRMIVVCLLFAFGLVVLALNAFNASDQAIHAKEAPFALPQNVPTSTSQQEWRKGSMPYLYQIDAQWAGKPYGNDTIGESGCGPTCLSMVYIRLTGKKDLGPVEMCAYSTRKGYLENGLTRWALMKEGAEGIGLQATELPGSADMVKQAVLSCQPVIAIMGPGDFTAKGHFVVICGIDDEGKAIVRDPNSEQNSQRSWDLDRLVAQARNLWAYSSAR